MTKGITLIETVVSVAIILVVMAIVSPVLASAKRRSQITSSIGRLRQLHMATMIYQGDHEPVAAYGTATQMGLPTLEYVARTRLGFTDRKFWSSPCGWNPNVTPWPSASSYEYRPDDDEEFAEYARTYGDKLLLFKDLHCDDTWKPIRAIHVSHRGLGVLLNGKVVNKYAQGDVYADNWWSEPDIPQPSSPFEEDMP